jgi:hypothetical protein
MSWYIVDRKPELYEYVYGCRETYYTVTGTMIEVRSPDDLKKIKLFPTEEEAMFVADGLGLPTIVIRKKNWS